MIDDAAVALVLFSIDTNKFYTVTSFSRVVNLQKRNARSDSFVDFPPLAAPQCRRTAATLEASPPVVDPVCLDSTDRHTVIAAVMRNGTS